MNKTLEDIFIETINDIDLDLYNSESIKNWDCGSRFACDELATALFGKRIHRTVYGDYILLDLGN